MIAEYLLQTWSEQTKEKKRSSGKNVTLIWKTKDVHSVAEDVVLEVGDH